MLKYKIYRKNDLPTTEWSGGTTTQLAIYPVDAVYADRNFTWRVSSAVIDAEESEFTPLSGISRIIMPIDGILRLEHKGVRSVVLKPFEQDRFEGGWSTVSYGKVTDFNLMMNGCEGYLNKPSHSIDTGKWAFLSEVYYFLADTDANLAGQEVARVNAGDVIVFEPRPVGEQSERQDITSEPLNVIRAVVYHN